MAPPAGTIKPARYLAIFILVVVALYALVFFTGDRKATPVLGIDLKGGTSVTLTARTPDGSEPTKESLNTARAIINERVDGLGVGGAEVVLDGSNIVITVPGENSDKAKTLARTAKLGFRKVLAGPFDPAAAKAAEKEAEKKSGEKKKAEQGDKKDSGGGSAVGAAQQDDQPPADEEDDGTLDEDTKQEIAQARKTRQAKDLESKDQAKQGAAIEAALKDLNCAKKAVDPLQGNDVPTQPLVACDQDRANVKERQAYVLGPVILDGTMVANSTSSTNPDGIGFQVNIDFTSDGNSRWSAITAEMAKESQARGPNDPARVAFTLDTAVVSAPSVTQQISGNTRITGDFTEAEARDLAQILKYGSLPLSFKIEDAQSVSPTLGLSSLQAGLVAGGIGMALVILYSLFYYRLLGVLLVASLVLTGLLVYALIILLGRSVGYTLDLAGVAGLIISIGVTADSFIVYFERIKDEIRDGRSVRSAIPRAWVRARRTILTADGVVLLAAVVLYLLSVGQVKGFAFTIGLSTIIDVVVVFMVTHPMLVLAGGARILNNRTLSGLGLVQDLGSATASRRKARPATAKGV